MQSLGRYVSLFPVFLVCSDTDEAWPPGAIRAVGHHVVIPAPMSTNRCRASGEQRAGAGAGYVNLDSILI